MWRKIDNKVIQVEGDIYWEVDIIAFRFYWTIIRTMRGNISDVKSTMDVLNIISPNISPHGSDDGSVELKRYSVDFSINLSFHWNYFVIDFSLHIVGLQSIIYFHI